MMKLSKAKNKEAGKFALMVACSVAMPILTALIGLHYYSKTFDTASLSRAHDHWGQFGDFLGGIVNPSVGLVTIILLVWTLRSQQIELKEQRRQMAKQAFEQMFYAWFSALQKSLSECHQRFAPGEEKSQQVGLPLFRMLIDWDSSKDLDLLEVIQSIENADSQHNRQVAISALQEFAWDFIIDREIEHSTDFIKPIRLLTEVLYFVHDNAALTNTEKKRYMNFLRASLEAEVIQALFLRMIGMDEDTNKLLGKYEFFYFLDARHAHTLLQAVLLYGAHPYSATAIDEDRLSVAKVLIDEFILEHSSADVV